MVDREFSFTTDTATMCIYDLECLKHRLEDDADWWSIPRVELEEVNLGNVAFLGLGDDGSYRVSIVDAFEDATVSTNINAPSGRIFIGAGEEVTSDGLEPECIRGGMFLDVEAGHYKIHARKDRFAIHLSLEKTTISENDHTGLLRL